MLNDDDSSDRNDEFGIETGGWCCFTNSLPIIYLRMWLNEKPNLTSFISRQIPMDVQFDTSNTDASKKRKASDTSTSAINNKSNKKSPNEQMADAIIGYIKVKEAVAVQPNNMSHSLSVEMEQFMQSQLSKEKIELLKKQISVIMRRVEQ